jgi:hypothetical protein
MDIKTIENEIYDFVSLHLHNYHNEIEEAYDFIENNRLIIPKDNYLKLSKYLIDTFRTFRSLDVRSMSETSKKLYHDIVDFQKYITVLEHMNGEKLFYLHFLTFSKVLGDFHQEIIEKKAIRLTIEEALLDSLNTNYDALKELYNEYFQEIFYNERTALIQSYKELLNCRLFYFEKLIYKEAKASNLITRYYNLQNSSLKLNSQSFLLYSLSLLHPSTEEHAYIQSCLRIYK